MTRRVIRLMIWASFVLPAVLPTSRSKPLLQQLTPFLIDGSNNAMVDLIFAASPLVL